MWTSILVLFIALDLCSQVTSRSADITIYQNGERDPQRKLTFTVDDIDATSEEIFNRLKTHVKDEWNLQISHFVNATGNNIDGIHFEDVDDHTDTAALISAGTVFAIKKEDLFMWPPISVSHRESVWLPIDSSKSHQFEVETVSLSPRIFRVQNFLTPSECNHLIELGASRLKPSTAGGIHDEYRNSFTAWLPPFFGEWSWLGKDIALENIVNRAASLLKIPTILSEGFQIVKYDHHQHLHAHWDYYYDDVAKTDNSNRYVTILYYLNDVPEGGETAFLAANNPSLNFSDPTQQRDCSLGLKVKPVKGSAVFFYNLLQDGIFDGTGDNTTFHAGCDVKQGVKWLSNNWFYNKFPQFKREEQERVAYLKKASAPQNLGEPEEEEDYFVAIDQLE